MNDLQHSKEKSVTHPPPQAAALASGMMDKLGRPGHFTLFAPTNEAFNKLSSGHLERMMGDKDVIAGTPDAR